MSYTTGKHQTGCRGDEPKAGHHVLVDSFWQRHRSKWLCCGGDCTFSACWFQLWSPLLPPLSHPSLWWQQAGQSSRDGPGTTIWTVVTMVTKNKDLIKNWVAKLELLCVVHIKWGVYFSDWIDTPIKISLKTENLKVVKWIHVYFTVTSFCSLVSFKATHHNLPSPIIPL